MHNSFFDGTGVIVPSSFPRPGESAVASFPVELIEAVIALGRNRWQLEDAVRFYSITDGGKREHSWTTVEGLEGKDLTGYSIIFYDANWEDSAWETSYFPASVIPYSEDSYFAIRDIWGREDESRTFQKNENVLLVKVDSESFSKQVAAEEIRIAAAELEEDYSEIDY